jgi:hypothetical protein
VRSKRLRAITKEADHEKENIIRRLGCPQNTIDIAVAANRSNGTVRSHGKIDSTLDALNKFIKKIRARGVELRFVYEAGPCGYQIYRYLKSKDIHCSVVAPSMIPKLSAVAIGSKPTVAMPSTWSGCFAPVS